MEEEFVTMTSAVKIVVLPVKILISLFMTSLFGIASLVVLFGGVSMLFFSCLVFVVFFLILTLREIGIKIVDALKPFFQRYAL
ncbi:MAG: hypothetical protein GY801_31350 [bacterium]|nr:hypothetical protein [bacterium]